MEKIKAAQSDDEILELLKQENIELIPEELQEVASGKSLLPKETSRRCSYSTH